MEAFFFDSSSIKNEILRVRVWISLGSETTKPSCPVVMIPLAPLEEVVTTGSPLAKASNTVSEQAS